MLNSLFTLDFEYISSIPTIITEVLFPEMMQYADSSLPILFEKPKKMEILKSYFDNFLILSKNNCNPIYLNCMNSFFPSNFK